MFSKPTPQPKKQTSVCSILAMALVGLYIYSASHGHAPLNNLIGNHTSSTSIADSVSIPFNSSDSSVLAMPKLPALPALSKTIKSNISHSTTEAQVYTADTSSTTEITIASVYPDLDNHCRPEVTYEK